MIKVSDEWVAAVEAKYPGFRDEVERRESAVLPVCSHCASADTASVLSGVIGRTISLGAATTRARLVPNRRPEQFYCNGCDQFF